MKKIQVFFLLAVAILLSSCASQIRLTAPADGAEECLLTPIQLKYVKMPRAERRVYFADAACRKEMASEGFYPRKVTLAWEKCKGANFYNVAISTTEDFAPGTFTEYATQENKIEVDNLMIATKYYWKVTCDNKTSKVGTFVTADIAPRLIRVPNVWNFRDLGGRIGLDGRRVKQNMVFRTGGLNDNAKKIYYTLEELLETSEEVRRNKAFMDETIKSLEETKGDLMPSLVSKEWIVFRPKMEAFSDKAIAEVIGLKDIPASILGGDGVKMTADAANNAISLTPFGDGMPAVFMQYIDAPEDGLVPFQCGADWYWRLAVNNQVVYDFWRGNDKMTSKDNFIMALPVKKGRNLVTLVLGSGSAGFTWHYGPIETQMTRDQILAEVRKSMKISFANMTKVSKRDADGKQMFIPGPATVTEEGRRYMLEEMGIKSEIDLRGDSECLGMTGSPLGPKVTWFHISSSSYGGMTGAFGRSAFTEVFKVFLDEKNYPIDFHCIAGQDRTGAVAFIINGLLGVAEEELYLDWEVTGFWNTSTDFDHKTRFDHLVAAFDIFEGATINERIEKYVLSLGFTHEDIQHLRDILLE